MTDTRLTRGADLRERIGHPILDADCHTVEYQPALAEYLRQESVDVDFDSEFTSMFGVPGSVTAPRLAMSRDERAARRVPRNPWWGVPTANPRDLAMVMLPRLFHERLDEIGIDFAVCYPTTTFRYPLLEAEDLRRGACRAANRYQSDIFADYRDRLEPVAIIPAHTPEEAIDELNYAVGTLGFKTVAIPDFVSRLVSPAAGAAVTSERYLDAFGVDSIYDYDPFWARCVELGIPVAMHSATQGQGVRTTTNFMVNHLGAFAAAHEGTATSLVMGGVTRRFPQLRIAFLEGGAGWAISLFGGIL